MTIRSLSKVFFSITLLLLLTGVQARAQLNTAYDTSLSIGGTQGTIFYAGEDNVLAVHSRKYPSKKLIIQPSQGTLDYPEQNGLSILSGLIEGTVTIRVFYSSDTGFQLLNQRTFRVQKREPTPEEENTLKADTKPQLSISGFRSGNIPVDVARKAVGFSLNPPYRIIKLQVLVGNEKNCFPNMYTLTSSKFDEHVRDAWNKLRPGDFIIINDITVMDDNGKIYALAPMNFNVVNPDDESPGAN